MAITVAISPLVGIATRREEFSPENLFFRSAGERLQA